jgi:TolA-binding protein
MNQKYIHNLFFFLVLSSTALLAEPSVYGFNNSSSGSTQDSRSSQNMIVQNKKTIASLKRQIAEQNERIDGLTSIIEGLSATLGELQGRGAGTSMDSGNDNTALLKELGTMIDKINDNYVSKSELQKALNAKGKYTPSRKDEIPQERGQKTISKESLEGRPASKLYSEGVRLFVKKRYSEATKRFTITDFKKSAGLYDQASYIDVLLLHTAISLEKSGDKAQARAFYENIIENYQGKKSARIAKEKLKKL